MPYIQHTEHYTIKVLEGKRTRYDDQYNPSVATNLRVKFLSTLPKSTDEAKDEIYDHFRFGCGCEHDCCGHWFGGAYKVRRDPRKKGEYTLRVISQRNI